MTNTLEKTEHKAGYKKTELGWIPENWDIVKLGTIAKTFAGGTPDRKNPNYYNGTIPWIKSGEVNNRFIKNTEEKITELALKESSAKMIPINSILVALYGATAGQVSKLLIQASSNQAVLAINSTNKNLLNDFIYWMLITNKQSLISIVQGSGQPNLNKNTLDSFKFILPDVLEQQKITETLFCWDNSIEKTEKLIETKTQLKKALMQKLLTGKLRFGEFAEQKWKKYKLCDIFTERKETSKDIEKYPLYSLTIEKGLTEKTERYERSFLLKDKEENRYRVVCPDDILYNPMNIRFGAIARSKIDKIVCVSAYYSVIELTNKNFDIGFFEHLFQSHKMFSVYESVATGSLIEKKRVHLSEFLKITIPCPSLEEQKKIAAVLNACDKEIELLKSKLATFQEQKKGLMQKLLTGQIRVQVN